MQYQDQSSSGLKYYLVNSDYDVSFMNIVKSKEILLDKDINIEFGILGASHYLKFLCGDIDMTEIFACSELPKDASEIVFADGASASDVQIKKNIGSSVYSFSSKLHKFSNGLSRSIFNDMNENRFFNEDLNKHYLGFEFPSNETNLPSLTLISLFLDEFNKSLDMETIHCYQAEEAFVHTKTRIEYAYF